jgi:hypothetical protein
MLLAALGGALAYAGASFAQAPGPAETPPARFTGPKFVDSRGCVFARVEVGGRVNWVPRVGPDRQPLCGPWPTVLAGVAPAAGATRPVQRPAIRTATPLPATTPSPLGTPRRAAAPAGPLGPRPAATVPRPAVVTVTAAPVRVILPPTLSADDVRIRARCPHVSGRVPSYRASSDMRCHAEPMHPPALVHGARVPAVPVTSPVTALRVERPSAPPGYSPAWTDGRLNPDRGIRTEAGEAEMRMIWTATVPRRLVPAN